MALMPVCTAKLVLLILLWELSFSCSGSHGAAVVVEGCTKQEIGALLQFKAKFQNPQILSSWVGDQCCNWRGIGCSQSSVTKINLSGAGLNPVIIADSQSLMEPVLDLPQLRLLDLSFNNFTGFQLPREIGKLSRLKYLDVSRSNMAGEIPSEIGKLSRLEYLSVAADVFAVPFNRPTFRSSQISWIENLSELTYLDFNGVDLRRVSSSFWEFSVSKLSKLRHLAMAGCKMEGTVPAQLKNLRELQYLDLSYNTFSEQQFPPWIPGMASLVVLNLSGCALRGPVPEISHLEQLSLDRNYYLSPTTLIFNGLKHIRRLSLSSCNITGILECSGILNLRSVFHLDLSSNGIAGSMPSCIQHLQNLEFLDVSFNNLTGAIQPSLGNLPQLSHLDLRHNKLNGSIPPSLSRLRLLRYLGLGNNLLSGTVPEHLELPPELRTLDISFNNFSSEISMNKISKLGNLEFLHMSYSGARLKSLDIEDGENPPEFRLQQLSLSSCNIQGTIPHWLSTQNSIVYLDLSNNMIQGSIPHWLWKLPELAQINISSNNLTGELPRRIHLQSQSSPKVVDLHNNRLQGPLPLSFGTMEVLDLSNNTFSGGISASVFEGHWDINFLSLSRNKLTGELPRSIAGSTSLEILDLSHNRLSGDLQGRFINCSSLVVLNLKNNSFSGELPWDMGNMTKLQSLHMDNNHLGGQLPSSLQNCRALEILELDYNNISGPVPEWIEHLSRLRIVTLKMNQLQGSIPRSIGMATNIQVLDLSNNRISGSIPAELGNFDGMVHKLQPTGPYILRYVIGFGMTMSPYTADAEDGLGLFYGAGMEVMSKGQDMHFDQIPSIIANLDLSNNKLQGHIPQQIGKLTGLITLNLSSNSLGGPIPETLGNMKQLESLDLSKNHLSSQIPVQLENLDFLGYLNLSINSLSGPVPQGRHFDTFDFKSFLGNPDLCGIVVNRSCTDPSGFENSGGSADTNAEDNETLWWYIGMGLSYGFGFSSIVTLLVMCKRVREAAFHVCDSAIESLHRSCTGA